MKLVFIAALTGFALPASAFVAQLGTLIRLRAFRKSGTILTTASRTGEETEQLDSSLEASIEFSVR